MCSRPRPSGRSAARNARGPFDAGRYGPASVIKPDDHTTGSTLRPRSFPKTQASADANRGAEWSQERIVSRMRSRRVLIGIGAGLAFPSLVGLAMSGATNHDAGLASVLVNTTRMVGGSLGLAAMASIATM